MGQLGVKTVGAQLATEPPPALDTTKDRRYWQIGLSVPGASVPPNWDRYNMWGLEKGFTQAAPNSVAPDKMQAIPCWFNRTGTIDKIIGTFSTTLATPAKIVLAIYGNNLDGEIWPGLKLAQSTEVVLDTGGSSAVVQWQVGYQVQAGTLLWLVLSVGQATVQHSGRGAAASEFPCIMGSNTIGTSGAPPSGFDPTPNAGIKSVDSTYNAIAPATFPLVNPALFLGLGTSDAIPLYAFRFVNS